jgi:hypothetical protein
MSSVGSAVLNRSPPEIDPLSYASASGARKSASPPWQLAFLSLLGVGLIGAMLL